MSAAPTSTGLVGRCNDCGRERECETRYDHGGRFLCDDCAAKPHKKPDAYGLTVDLEAARAKRAAEADETGLAERLAASRINLVDAIEHGIPEREWLPASANMLARGKRVHVSAKLKSGKSLAFLAHSVDIVSAGGTVAILDRENGGDEYARRLASILDDRPTVALEAARQRLHYYAWPQLKISDGDALARELAGADLVIFDSTRTTLTGLALDEDRSNDYAEYAAKLIDPLMRAGIAPLQLDNAGHGDQGRARGSSSKGDLADVVYTLKTLSAFDEAHTGKVRLVRQHSRFGDVGAAFTMELGGGTFGSFTLEQEERDTSAFRPTVLMERTSRCLEEKPGLSWSALRSSVKGNNEWIDLGLELLIADGYVRAEQDGQARRHYSVRPYREADDNPAQTLPKPCPGQGAHNPAPLPTPIGQGQGQAAGSSAAPAHDELPLATLEEEALATRLAAEAEPA